MCICRDTFLKGGSVDRGSWPPRLSCMRCLFASEPIEVGHKVSVQNDPVSGFPGLSTSDKICTILTTLNCAFLQDQEGKESKGPMFL